MRLFTTGAVCRAARSARLSAPPRCKTRAIAQSGRWQSTQTEAASSGFTAFPDQSAAQGQEVDPLKTAVNKRNPQRDGDRQRFEERLKSRSDSEIIHSGGLSGAKIGESPWVFDETSNLTSNILNLIDRNLYNAPNHPINITRKLIESVFASPEYKNHIAINPVVTTWENFDALETPKDHPARSRTGTYYVDSDHVLRTHTSAHEHAAFTYMAKHPEPGYTICADVYRRDSIDRTHFPVFHQMEGARTWRLQYKDNDSHGSLMARQEQITDDLRGVRNTHLEVDDPVGDFNLTTNPTQLGHDTNEVSLMVRHLKRSLEVLVDKVFKAALAARGEKPDPQKPLKVRWIEAYFPFTSPSFELEVFWGGDWLELLGCGITQQPILNHAGLEDRVGWAWGIGIERLAMILFEIPDIRLFWSTDKRFLDQFKDGEVVKFRPFSKYPECYKDVSFWVNAAPATASPVSAQTKSGVAAATGGDATKAAPNMTQPAAFHENDLMEIIRDEGGTLIEDVRLADEFVHPGSGRKSLCYRINYRSLERTLTNDETNPLHRKVVARLAKELPIEVR